MRSTCQGQDSTQQLGLERNLWVKGIESVEVYTTLFWIAEIAAALTRAKNGVSARLLKANRRTFA